MAADTQLQYLEKIKQSTGGLNPIQQTEYQNLLAAQPQVSSATSFDPVSQAQKLLEFQKQANQPAITSLQAQKEPLKLQYENIIAQLKGTQETQVSTAQKVAGQEFGYRGIPLSSTAFGEYLAGKVNPLQQYFANQIQETGYQQQKGLTDIDQLIAQLQSGDSASALSNAIQILGLQQQQTLSEKEFGLKEQIANKPQDQFATLGEGSTLFNLATGQPLCTAPKTYKGENT